MSIFGRLFAAGSILDEPDAWTPRLMMYGGGTKTSSGETVTPQRSLTLSAYFACLRVLHDDIGRMPFVLLNRRTQQEANAPANLLEFPNATMSGQVFRGLLLHWAAGWGIGAAEIERDGAGRPAALHPIHPSRVSVMYDKQSGRYFYRVTGDKGMDSADFWPDELFTVFGMGPNGYQGYSVAQYGANTIGLGLAANEFASGYYRNGGGINIAIKLPRKLAPEAKAALRDSWLKRHGSGSNQGKPALLEDGMELERFDIPANEAQMLESRQFQVEEIARWFRISPVKIGHNQNVPFANLEAVNRQHLDEALMPWVIRFETEAARKLLTQQQRNNVYYRARVTDIARGDTQQRANLYRTFVSIGVMSPDDVRVAEDMPVIGTPASQAYYMQSAMATIDQIQEGQNRTNNQLPQGEPGRPSRDEAEQIIRPLVQDALERLEAKSQKAHANKAKLKESDPQAWQEWHDRFHVEQQAYLLSMLGPVVASMRHIGDLTDAAETVVAWIAGNASSEDLVSDIVKTFCDELEL